MPTFQVLTTSSTDLSEVVGECFFTGRPVTMEEALLIGTFNPAGKPFDTFTILVHKDTDLRGLHPGYIKRFI